MAKPKQPLAGKRIVVTRAADQSVEFAAQLEALGAEVLRLPLVSFSEPRDVAPLDDAVLHLDQFDWIVFTSRNAVKALAGRFKFLQIPPERVNHLLSGPRVATIGSATTDEALSAGFLPEYQAKKSTSEELAGELLGEVRGKRVLLPRSDLADSRFPRILRESGADVVELTAYRTVIPSSLDTTVVKEIQLGNVDVITLFSPSSYHHLAEQIDLDILRQHLGHALRRYSGKIVLATIGPTTSSVVRSDGLKVGIEATEASGAALCEAIITYFEQRGEVVTE
ncbi:MAG TPA: uroporphyrinogen-III synthase [Candidatus Acidoferrales bacterium]|nr:uroporphyrinogen-III synthase [Candidatus Acidoferrales bacterium]